MPLGALDLHDEHILLPPSARVSEAAQALLDNPEHSILIYEGVAKKGMFSFLGGKKEKVLGIISLDTLMHSLDELKRISGKHSITKVMKSVLLEYHVGTPLELVVKEIAERQPYGVIARADDGTFVGFMSMADFQEARALVNGRVPPSETRIIRHGPTATLSNLLKPNPSTGIFTSKPMILHPHQTYSKLIDSLVLNINGQAIVSNLSKKDVTEGLSSLYINQISGTANVRTVLKILASGNAPKTMKFSDSKHLDSAWLNMSEESLFSRVKESSSKGGWNSLLVTDSRDRVLAAFSKAEFARHESGGSSSTQTGGSAKTVKSAKPPFIRESETNSPEVDSVLKTIDNLTVIRPPDVEEHGEDDTHQAPDLSDQDIEEILLNDSKIDLEPTTEMVSIPIEIEEPEEDIDNINDSEIEPEIFNMEDASYSPDGDFTPNESTTTEPNLPPAPPPAVEMEPMAQSPPPPPPSMQPPMEPPMQPPMAPPSMPPQMEATSAQPQMAPPSAPPQVSPPSGPPDMHGMPPAFPQQTTDEIEHSMNEENSKTTGGRYI